MVDTEDTRTRLPSFQTRLASSPSADEPHRDGQQVRAQTSRANREALLQTSGLDLEKTLSSPVEAELFFLTSLFIELIGLKKGEQTAQAGEKAGLHQS